MFNPHAVRDIWDPRELVTYGSLNGEAVHVGWLFFFWGEIFFKTIRQFCWWVVIVSIVFMAAFCGKNDAWYDDGLSLLSRELFDCIQWFALLRIRNQFIELQLSCD